jgi:hypothetical protein
VRSLIFGVAITRVQLPIAVEIFLVCTFIPTDKSCKGGVISHEFIKVTAATGWLAIIKVVNLIQGWSKSKLFFYQYFFLLNFHGESYTSFESSHSDDHFRLSIEFFAKNFVYPNVCTSS